MPQNNIYQIIVAVGLLVLFLILPKIWRTRLLGTALAILVIYLIIENFETLLMLIHVRD